MEDIKKIEVVEEDQDSRYARIFNVPKTAKRDVRKEFLTLNVKTFVNDVLEYNKKYLNAYRGRVFISAGYDKSIAEHLIDFIIEMEEFGYAEEEVTKELITHC